MGTASKNLVRGRILVIDDGEPNRDLTEAVLRNATYDVDCVGDGRAALAALGTKSYDLILMDLDRPGQDGQETAAAMQRHRHGRVKFAALSARRGMDARLRSRAVGMSAHIARPIAPQDLLAEIERVFKEAPPAERPDPWDRRLYDEWVERLGSERMLGFLGNLLEQFRGLLAMAVDFPALDRDELHRKAHDVASTAGTLGFLEVTSACRALLEAPDIANEARTRPALIDALERAFLRLDRHLATSPSRAFAA